MEVKIELKEMFEGKEYRQTRTMTLEYILLSSLRQHTFYSELMTAVNKMREAQQNKIEPPTEPIKEEPAKNWQVVEFEGKRGVFNHKCHDGALPNRDKWEALFIKENYPIHSVKRMSDGEVFTVNSRYKSCSICNTHTIKSFQVKDGRLIVKREDGRELYFSKIILVSKEAFQWDGTDEGFLNYLVSQKEDAVKRHDFETASEWRVVERLYRNNLKIKLVEKPKGAFISLNDVVENYLKSEQSLNTSLHERIEVGNVWFEDYRSNGGGLWGFDTNKNFDPEKLPLIKDCIEYILNNNEVGYWDAVDRVSKNEKK